MSARRYTLASAYFQAARRLEGCGPGHPSARLHGHGFRARLRAHLPEGWGGCPGGEPEALVARLRATLAPLDYRCLNELLAEPDDAGVARWLWPRLDLAGLDSLGLDSTPWQGVELDASGQVRVWRRYRFEAAHRLPYVPPGHPCGRLHGHGFEVILHAALDSDTPGCPYDALDARWAPLHSELHQACLNDLPGLDNPTSERLAAWLWQQLEPEWAALGGVTVLETASAGCHYDGAHYRIWKEQSF
ncbi:MAG TPA: 6-carboxytetrahydropterin synthase, partial [Candidatus Competibacteraceae bacterium]|nr:6-carboxytetrahydropterin synthase [Candidatus Competibacteraceae bacterium]